MAENDTPAGTEALSTALRPTPKRPVLFFTIPVSELPPESEWTQDLVLGVVALSPDEEIEAAKRSRGDEISINYEFCKMALRGIQEPGGAIREVDRAQAEHEVLWSRIGPKGRNIAMMCFREISAASAEAVLASRKSFRWASI
jgi:hypothetical protein